ncbi:PIF1 DNA helicase/replication protein A1-like protein [Tanacetum coccineum]
MHEDKENHPRTNFSVTTPKVTVHTINNKRKANGNQVLLTSDITKVDKKLNALQKQNNTSEPVIDISKRAVGRPSIRRPLTEITGSSINELVNSKRKSGRPKKIQTVDAIQKDKSCCSEGVNKKSECETPTQVDTSVNKLAQPINLVPSSIRQLTPRKNNTSKRTRTPTSLSPASIKYPSVVLSGPLMDLTLRPRGRPRKSDISTSTPLQQRTHLPSLTPKSTLLNGSGIVNPNIETTRKWTFIAPNKTCSTFNSQTPIQANLGLTSYKNDNLSHGQSSLVTSDMLKLRPRGRPRKSENSTDTPLQSVTCLGSLCPKSTITNCSRFLKLTPVKFDLGTGYSLKDKNKAKPDKTEHGFGKSTKN